MDKSAPKAKAAAKPEPKAKVKVEPKAEAKIHRLLSVQMRWIGGLQLRHGDEVMIFTLRWVGQRRSLWNYPSRRRTCVKAAGGLVVGYYSAIPEEPRCLC